MTKTTALAAVALLAVACGGTKHEAESTVKQGVKPSAMPSAMPSAGCVPGGTTLTLAAQNVKYSTDCLAAPANVAFTIHFENKDAGIQHTVSIYAADKMTNDNAKQFFKGEQFAGVASKDFSIPALAAGSYHFHCDVHPAAMAGTLKVA